MCRKIYSDNGGGGGEGGGWSWLNHTAPVLLLGCTGDGHLIAREDFLCVKSYNSPRLVNGVD